MSSTFSVEPFQKHDPKCFFSGIKMMEGQQPKVNLIILVAVDDMTCDILFAVSFVDEGCPVALNRCHFSLCYRPHTLLNRFSSNLKPFCFGSRKNLTMSISEFWSHKRNRKPLCLIQFQGKYINTPNYVSSVKRFVSSLKVENLRKLLAVSGCPMNVQNGQTGRSLLAVAVATGNTAIVVALLQESGVRPEMRDFEELSALDIAIERDDREVVGIMMGCARCWTGLHSAMRRSKSTEMTGLLQMAFKRRQEELLGPALTLATTVRWTL